MPSDNWTTAGGAALTASSAGDQKTIDFGAALGTLIAAVNSSQPNATNASSNDSQSSPPATSGAKRVLGRTTMTAPAFPNQNFLFGTSAAFAFDAFVTPTSDSVNASSSRGEADANDVQAPVDTISPIANTRTTPVEVTPNELKFRTIENEAAMGQNPSLAPEAWGPLPAESPLLLQRFSHSNSGISQKVASNEGAEPGRTHADALARTQESVSAEIKVNPTAEGVANRTPSLQTELNAISSPSARPAQSTGRQTQDFLPRQTSFAGSDGNNPAQFAAAKSSIRSLEPAGTTTRHDHPVDRNTPTVSAEAATSAQSVLGDATATPHASVVKVTHETQATPSAPPARIANLKVELGDGQSAQATVRERSGAVEVKIVASTTSAAQRIVHEVESLRSGLDSAGLRLARAEVSYQQPYADRRQGERNPHRDRATQTATGTEVFTVSEANE